MKANFASDPTLYGKCLTLMDSCFPGVKALADKGRERNAYWDKCSTPFIIEHNHEIVAHLGLWPFDFLINEKPYRAAAFHGICTREDSRRKGYFKQLMQEAQEQVRQHFDLAFMFTDKPYLYEQFGFKIAKEYDFIVDCPAHNVQASKIRKLVLDNPKDLSILQNHYLNRIPLSKAFSIVNETAIATLNALHTPVHYIEDMDILVVYQIKDDVLYVKDVVSTKPYDLNSVLKNIGNTFSKVVLQFIPDKFLTPPFNPVEAITDGFIMISKEFDLSCEHFRYPEVQRC